MANFHDERVIGENFEGVGKLSGVPRTTTKPGWILEKNDPELTALSNRLDTFSVEVDIVLCSRFSFALGLSLPDLFGMCEFLP